MDIRLGRPTVTQNDRNAARILRAYIDGLMDEMGTPGCRAAWRIEKGAWDGSVMVICRTSPTSEGTGLAFPTGSIHAIPPSAGMSTDVPTWQSEAVSTESEAASTETAAVLERARRDVVRLTTRLVRHARGGLRARAINTWSLTTGLRLRDPAWTCTLPVLAAAFAERARPLRDPSLLIEPTRITRTASLPSGPTEYGSRDPQSPHFGNTSMSRGRISADGLHAVDLEGRRVATCRFDEDETALHLYGVTLPESIAQVLPGLTLDRLLDLPGCGPALSATVIREVSMDQGADADGRRDLHLRIECPDVLVAPMPPGADVSWTDAGRAILTRHGLPAMATIPFGEGPLTSPLG